MKLAYRIATPFFALATLALALFLPFFSITISWEGDTARMILGIALAAMGRTSPSFEVSIFALLKGGVQSVASSSEEAKMVMDAINPIKGQLIAFLVLFAIVVLLLLAIAVLGALANSKKRRNIVMILSGTALIISFAAILVSNAAFKKVDEISLYPFVAFFLPDQLARVLKNLADSGSGSGDLVSSLIGLVGGLFSGTSTEDLAEVGRTLLQNEAVANLVSTFVDGYYSLGEAILSAGFFAVFGMLILLILWTVLSNFILKNPIQRKRTHRRKKPLRSPFASKKA